jgi:basic amino acid/polyamine antiporter, APA family
MPMMSLPPGVSDAGLPHATGLLQPDSWLIVGDYDDPGDRHQGVGQLQLGDRDRQAGVVGIFLVVGGYFLFHHPDVASANWHPFIPPPDGHGNFGWGALPGGAASIFFAYIGFDAVSTAAQEAKNPQRDMPIGILGSLVVCTILYILVSLVLTGLVNYKTLNVSAPVALASMQRASAGARCW